MNDSITATRPLTAHQQLHRQGWRYLPIASVQDINQIVADGCTACGCVTCDRTRSD